MPKQHQILTLRDKLSLLEWALDSVCASLQQQHNNYRSMSLQAVCEGALHEEYHN